MFDKDISYCSIVYCFVYCFFRLAVAVEVIGNRGRESGFDIGMDGLTGRDGPQDIRVDLYTGPLIIAEMGLAREHAHIHGNIQMAGALVLGGKVHACEKPPGHRR